MENKPRIPIENTAPITSEVDSENTYVLESDYQAPVDVGLSQDVAININDQPDDIALAEHPVNFIEGIHKNPDWMADHKEAHRAGWAELRLMKENTKKDEQIETLTEEAETDPLTGLPNRRAYDRRISELLSNSDLEPGSIGLMILDVDGFKQVNDTLGHPVGDRALKMIAKNLRDTLRAGDEVFRVGGDEFVIILPFSERNEQYSDGSIIRETRVATELVHQKDESRPISIDEDAAERIKGRLLASLIDKFTKDKDDKVVTSASIGLALVEPGDTPDSLYERADAQTYQDKGGKPERIKHLSHKA